MEDNTRVKKRRIERESGRKRWKTQGFATLRVVYFWEKLKVFFQYLLEFLFDL